MARTSNDPLIKDYQDLTKLIENNNLSGLRAAQNFIPRQLYALQKRLAKIRNNETLLLQRLRRDLDLTQLEGERADHFMKLKAMQSFEYTDPGWPDPHQRINYDRNKLLRNTTGIQDQIAELDRYGHLIKTTQARIKQLQGFQKKVNDALGKEIEQKDIEADKISERSVSELMLLELIHLEYLRTTQDKNENRKYTQDPKTVKLLEELQLRFTAFAERNSFVLSGKITLNLLDPGDTKNGVILGAQIEAQRKLGRTDKVEDKVRKYVSSLIRNLNDNFISQDVRRRQQSTNEPAEGDQFSLQTSTLGKFLNYTGDVGWWMSLGYNTFIEAAENAFKYKTSALYNGRPICNSQPTQEEQARDTAIEDQEAQVVLGESEYEARKNLALSKIPRSVVLDYEITLKAYIRASELGDEEVADLLVKEMDALIAKYPDLPSVANV